jgi:hypothetical protein
MNRSSSYHCDSCKKYSEYRLRNLVVIQDLVDEKGKAYELNKRTGKNTNAGAPGGPDYHPHHIRDGQCGRDHLRLGLTLKAFRAFVNKRVRGYTRDPSKSGPFWVAHDDKKDFVRRCDDGSPLVKSQLACSNCDRPAREHKKAAEGLYIPSAYGPNTGYDLNEATKSAHQSSGAKYLSHCEVLLRERSPEVGEADVFFSHIQKVPLEITIQSLSEAVRMHPELNESTKFFIDYCSIRQCQSNDFDLAQVRAAIHNMPLMLVELDGALNRRGTAAEPEWFKRSFCVFEAFAAVEAKNRILICGPAIEDTKTSPRLAEGSKVDSKRAKCRSHAHKEEIDSFIRKSVGHEELDGQVAAAIVEGVKRGLQLFDSSRIRVVACALAVGVRACALTDKQLRQWAEQHEEPTEVFHLDLAGCSLITELPSSFKRFACVQQVSLADCACLSNCGALCLLPSLTSLDLTGCCSLNDATQLTRLTPLQKLDIGQCGFSRKQVAALRSELSGTVVRNLENTASVRTAGIRSADTGATTVYLGVDDQSHANSPPSPPPEANSGSRTIERVQLEEWVCIGCTYEDNTGTHCEMCEEARPSGAERDYAAELQMLVMQQEVEEDAARRREHEKEEAKVQAQQAAAREREQRQDLERAEEQGRGDSEIAIEMQPLEVAGDFNYQAMEEDDVGVGGGDAGVTGGCHCALDLPVVVVLLGVVIVVIILFILLLLESTGEREDE